ncbi:MAG: tetratricopeptide repeat protein [Ilyomonas sp.]
MKKFCLVTLFLLFGVVSFSQQNADTLRETARMFMQQGDLDNAILVLNKAAELKPEDVAILRDQAYANYLRRDYAKAIEIGKVLIEKPGADVQSFQILGMVYKAIADYKEADKLYKKALKKFPESGVLYSEYGDLLATTNNADAIKMWEKGIQVDPNISSNYYYASKYYSEKGNALWSVLYGETFVNIESLSQRTIEIKDLVYYNYKQLFITDILSDINKKGSPFEKAVATIYQKLSKVIAEGITPESLTVLRTRFILNWYQDDVPKFPFRLFEHQQLLLRQGIFNAYNQWLFGATASTRDFQFWVNTHEEEMKDFQNYQRSVVYKIPANQYYPH